MNYFDLGRVMQLHFFFFPSFFFFFFFASVSFFLFSSIIIFLFDVNLQMLSSRGCNFSHRMLVVSPLPLVDGSDATVTFSNIQDPSTKDYITVSCGPTNGTFNLIPRIASHAGSGIDDFITYEYVPSPAAASGAVLFRALYFMRCNYTYGRISACRCISNCA